MTKEAFDILAVALLPGAVASFVVFQIVKQEVRKLRTKFKRG